MLFALFPYSFEQALIPNNNIVILAEPMINFFFQKKKRKKVVTSRGSPCARQYNKRPHKIQFGGLLGEKVLMSFKNFFGWFLPALASNNKKKASQSIFFRIRRPRK